MPVGSHVHIESFTCENCGQTHAGLTTDLAFQLPDEVWALSVEERSVRAEYDTDLCMLDGRTFIRCMLEIPFRHRDGYFGWGIWVEVERAVFHRYLALYESDGTAEPRHAGKIANALAPYGDTLGGTVLVQCATPSQRPRVYLPATACGRLAQERRNGMECCRHHEIVG